MSRYAFTQIIKNEEALIAQYELCDGDSNIEDPRDLKGYSLLDWFDDAAVGWDEPLQTYFIQCIEIEDGSDLAWWFGTSDYEIPTFEDLCKIINAVFKNSVNFEFINVIVKSNDPAYL